MSSRYNAGDGERGPAWWDVRAYAKELERDWHLVVYITIVSAQAGTQRWQGELLVRVEGRRAGKTDETVVVGLGRFGGGAGTKTITSAIYAGLLDAQLQLEAAESSSAAQAAF